MRIRRETLLVLLAAAPLAGCGEGSGRPAAPGDGAAGGAARTDGAAAPRALRADEPGDEPGHDLPPLKVVEDGARDTSEPAAYEVVPPEFSLGVVFPNESLEREFELHNRGDRPFNIMNVTTECRCVALKHDRSMIPPGGSVKLKANIVATTAGQRTTAINLHLSDRARSKVRVQFHYAIVPQVLVEPKKLDLGRVETGKPIEATTRVTLHLPDEIAQPPPLAPFIVHDLPIKVWLDEPTITELPGGTRDWVTTLHLRLQSDVPLPQFETQLVFKPDDPKHFSELLVPVTGEVVPAWYFERGVVGFGQVEVGQEAAKEMRFFYPAGDAPEVQEIGSDIEGLDVTSTLDAERSCYVLALKLVAQQPGKIEGTVSLKTSLSSEPATLRVTARAK